MSTNPKKWAGIAIGIAVTTAVVFASCGWKLHTRTPPKENRTEAPDFSLVDYAGNTHTLDGALEGGAAVVVFYRGFW